MGWNLGKKNLVSGLLRQYQFWYSYLPTSRAIFSTN